MTKDLEQLSKEQIQGKIIATNKSLQVLEGALSKVSKKRKEMDPVIYNIVARGYAGGIVDLRKQLKEYQGLLK